MKWSNPFERFAKDLLKDFKRMEPEGKIKLFQSYRISSSVPPHLSVFVL